MAADAIGVYSNSNSPAIFEYTLAGSQTFAVGAVLTWSSGLAAEASANPSDIIGVALAAANTAPGYDAGNSPSPITWRENRLPVAVAYDSRNTFVGRICNNTTDSTSIAPVAADLGAQYGITKQATGGAAGSWFVDKNKTTTNARVEIVKIDTENNLVHFVFTQTYVSTLSAT